MFDYSRRRTLVCSAAFVAASCPVLKVLHRSYKVVQLKHSAPTY